MRALYARYRAWGDALAVLFWMLIAFLIGVAVANAQAPVWTLITGPVSATETEASECYFQISHGAMIVFRPDSTPCQIVRQELLGKSIKLQAIIEAP
jgi:hypothetical protein